MKFLKVTGWSMISFGSLILLFLAYQLVFTNLLTARAQSSAETALEERFEALREDVLDEVDVQTLPGGIDEPVETEDGTPPPTNAASERATAISYFPEDSPALGTEIGRITIEKIKVDLVVIQGVDRDNLKKGPGHMTWTPMPGQPGNSVISGHRVTNGTPFFNLNEVVAGDQITVETVTGTHVYAVRETLVVLPTDVWVTNSRPGAWLTLTTCNPRYSARERLVIVAELVDGPNLEYAQALKDDIVEDVSA
jgi:sortase A